MSRLARSCANALLARGAAAAVAVALGCAGARGAARTAASGAGATAQRTYPVPEHGALVMDVPHAWKERTGAEEGEPGGDRGATTVELAPPDRAFVLLVTPFFNPGDEAEERRADTARLFVELARRKALSTSTQDVLPIEELTGPQGVLGYWFSAADRTMEGRAPKSDEYRNLIQGAAAVGRLLVAFTLLDNAPGPHREAALAMVASARHAGAAGAGGARGAGSDADSDEGSFEEEDEAGAGERPGHGFEPDPGAATAPLLVSAPDGSMTVLVDLPGFQMFKPKAGEDGESVIVLGQDPKRDLVASVILRRAPGVDAKGCREDALARISRATRLADVHRTEAAGSARASYILPELNGRPIRQSHVHLFLARGDVCVNVHVSKAEPRPEDAVMIEKILASVRLAESL